MGGGLGGMPPMGGGMGMDPMGGGMGGQQQPQTKIKFSNVWDVLEKILEGKPLENEKEDKKGGQEDSNMVNNAQQQQQPPQQPSPTAPQLPPQQGMAPSGPPQTQHLM